jgi:hypothetical protein
MKIRLHIERLVLDSLPAEGLQQDALHRQVSSELERLIREWGLDQGMQRSGAHDRLPGGDLALPRLSNGRQPNGQRRDSQGLGHDIARSIFQAIGSKQQGESKPVYRRDR